MTDVTVANTGSAPAPLAPALAEKAPPSFAAQNEWSASDAARLLASRRQQKQAEPAPTAPEPPQPEQAEQAEQELAPEANAAPQEIEAHSETTETIEPETPPIDPPRSWTKEAKERWQSLPRETQEYLSSREQEREREFRRSQNEAAEQRKAAQAEREAAEQARKQYEAQLPSVMQALQDAQNGAFADIRTVDDVTKLAQEDPFRYLQWQAHQTKLQAVHAEVERAKTQKQREEQTNWAQHVQKENELAAELIPELADKVKGPALTQRAADRLNELGFKQEELAALASGEKKLSIYDHRIQRLIFSDLKLSDIQSAKNAVVSKPVPHVARPGTAKPAANSNASKIQALERELSTAPGHRQAKLMAEIRTLRRAGTSR